MTLTGALTTAILPVLSITAVGFVLGRFVDVEVRPLSVVTVYVLAPALVFDSMVTTELEGSQIGALAAGVGVVTVAMVIVGEAAAWLDGTEGASRNGLVLASTFSNCGNFGIPLSAFAFGAVGRSTAVLYLVAQNVLMYTLGVYLAARGDRRSALPGVTEVFRLPLVYALAAGLLGRQFGVLPPPQLGGDGDGVAHRERRHPSHAVTAGAPAGPNRLRRDRPADGAPERAPASGRARHRDRRRAHHWVRRRDGRPGVRP
jgi:predicted permease